jgi:hypothetical protein
MKVDKNNELYTADTPIVDSKNDFFQRIEFSKRIADTISKREVADSIVIGVYGDWGEGKTSVLNLIQRELSTNENIVICKFNPWRYKDENQLLCGFFQMLAFQLNKSIKTKGEKIGKVISDYADLIVPSITLFQGVIGLNPGSLIKHISEKYNTIDIDVQKNRIEEILSKEQKKVVIFIDDIDRLDKKEIQTVFKLVKLTGDFLHTAYVLAFDEKMVAKAIGEIYEDGGESAGKNFLEKIIQVPLRLPRASSDSLRDFCFKQVDKAIASNNIELSKIEINRFVDMFASCLLFRLSTPRMAIRYGNALAFAMPLLYKEVNTVDLMLIEAIKVFYPELYDFIKNNSEYFLRGYSSDFTRISDSKNEKRKTQCKEEIDKIAKSYTDKEFEPIKKLLIELFPVLNEVYHNYGHSDDNLKQWYINKSIGSPSYFNRYFSYSVQKGEISDIIFDEFILNFSNCTENEDVPIVQDFIELNGIDSFVTKLWWCFDKFSQDAANKLVTVLSRFGDKIPYSQNSIFGLDTPLGKLTYLFYKQLQNIENKVLRLTISKEILNNSSSLDLSFEFFRWIEYDSEKSDEENLFNESETSELKKVFLDKAISDFSDFPFFQKYPRNAAYLFSHVWIEVYGKQHLMEYIKPILNKSPKLITDLLRAFSPIIHSSNHPKPYDGDLSQENYNQIEDTFDTDYLYSIALIVYGENVYDGSIQILKHLQTEDNRVKQFVYYYKKIKEKKGCL